MQFMEVFKNKAGQYSGEEVLKIGAVIAGVVLAYLFFLTPRIPTDKGPYFVIVETALFGYALAQGVAHNVTNQ